MDIMVDILERRRSQTDRLTEADNRWLRERGGIDPAERLILWDNWIRKLLEKVLVWPKAESARLRLQGQCAAELKVMVRQLAGRGWLLDGHVLAQHVRALLEPIGEAQRAGKVEDFWPFFRASVSRYVGTNAEEIQQDARRSGGDEGVQAIGSLLGGVINQLQRGPSMVELLNQRAGEIAQAKADLREKAKARKAACKAAADRQQELF